MKRTMLFVTMACVSVVTLAGAAWAATPVITNMAPTNITWHSACMNGDLTDTGGVPTFVWLYWGDNDALDVAANWDHSRNLGQKSTGTLTTNVAWLGSGIKYYYRYCATNSAGTNWAAPSSNFTTQAHPSNITWGSWVYVANDTNVLNNGYYVDATTLYPGTNLTINTVLFRANPVVTGSAGDRSFVWTNSSILAHYNEEEIWYNVCGGGAGMGGTDLQKLLGGGVCAGLSHNAFIMDEMGTITLGGLETGRRYQVQLFSVPWDNDGYYTRIDNTSGSNGRLRTGGSGGSQYPTYVVGTFTADAPTQVISMRGDGGGDGGSWCFFPSAISLRTPDPFGGATAPVITNAAATNITWYSASMRGYLNDNGGVPTFVWLYWGDNDGQNTNANWDHTNSFGQASLGLQATNITGLDASATYCYRYYATNSAGTNWASPSSSFTTLAAPTAPVITNASPTMVIPWCSAYVNGYLSDTGTVPAFVWLYWGDDDGQDGAWDHTVSLGQKGTGPLSTYIDGLAAGMTLYYRYYATNWAGKTWAEPSSNLTTAAHAPITWGSCVYVNDDSDVLTNECYYDATTLFPGSNLTVNTVEFNANPIVTGSAGNRSFAWTWTNSDISAHYNEEEIWYNASGGGSNMAGTDLQKLLGGGICAGLSHNTNIMDNMGTITLGGLVTGRNYQVQLFSVPWDNDGYWTRLDDTTGANGRLRTGGSGGSQYPTYVVGTFTAIATNQLIYMRGDGGGDGGSWCFFPSAISLRSDKPKPPPATIGTVIKLR